jgi:hypothetical protein
MASSNREVITTWIRPFGVTPAPGEPSWASRAFVVFGIAPVRCAQGDHPFAFAGEQEFPHHLESTGKIATDTEMNATRDEYCWQPSAGKTAVKQQQIMRAQETEGFEEHLSFATRLPSLQLEAEKQFDSRQVKPNATPLTIERIPFFSIVS